MYFISIVLVFMFAFGVSTQSLMYHNQALNLDLLKNVFFPSYFIIAGEYYTRETIMSRKNYRLMNKWITNSINIQLIHAFRGTIQ